MRKYPKSPFLCLFVWCFVAFLSIESNTFSQDSTAYALCKDSVVQFGTNGGANCWGWTSPTGVEYAIMGVFNGVVFVNTSNMHTDGFAPGPTGSPCGGIQWREIKTYQHYCYVVSECTGPLQGLMVIDMSYLPDSVHTIGTYPVNGSNAYTSHTLSIDSVNGYLYAEGNSSPSTSLYIHNLSNPSSPVYVSSFGISNGIHDMYAYDDTVYVAEGSSGRFAIWNCANKSSPSLLARVLIPNAGYVHNVWPTLDRHYAATTEETTGKTVKIWDISNLSNITLVGQYLGPNGMAHNALFKHDTLYLAHYESGISVVSIADPTHPLEMARYDTYPEGEGPPAFNGSWGCYPFTSNGEIFASNVDGRLWVLNEQKIQLADTLYPGPPIRVDSGNVRIDFYAINSLALKRITIPFSYAGPAPMFFTACSTNGTRTQGFPISQTLGVDLSGKKVAWQVGINTGGTPLPPGSGIVLSAWFTIETDYMGPINPVSFIDTWLNLKPTFEAVCTKYRPVDLDYVEVCCVGNRGDLNGDTFNANILDLTFLVDLIFRGGPASICPQEADVNGDSNSADIIDLTFVVDFVFRGGPPPGSCP